jgi:hypothetical protein
MERIPFDPSIHMTPIPLDVEDMVSGARRSPNMFSLFGPYSGW